MRPYNAELNGRYEIPTLEEIVDLADELTRELGRPIGVYPETKHPSYHASLGLDLEPPLIALLRERGLHGPEPRLPVFLQSFEADSLRKLQELEVPLVFLMGTGEQWQRYTTPEGLAEVASFAQAIGPEKSLVIPVTEEGGLGEPTSLVADAHEAGLLVHPYTFRSENHFLPPKLRSGDDPTAPLPARVPGPGDVPGPGLTCPDSVSSRLRPRCGNRRVLSRRYRGPGAAACGALASCYAQARRWRESPRPRSRPRRG